MDNERQFWFEVWRLVLSFAAVIAKRWKFGKYGSDEQTIQLSDTDNIGGITGYKK